MIPSVDTYEECRAICRVGIVSKKKHFQRNFSKDNFECKAWTWATAQNPLKVVVLLSQWLSVTIMLLHLKETCFLFSSSTNETQWDDCISGPNTDCTCSQEYTCGQYPDNALATFSNIEKVTTESF